MPISIRAPVAVMGGIKGGAGRSPGAAEPAGEAGDTRAAGDGPAKAPGTTQDRPAGNPLPAWIPVAEMDVALGHSKGPPPWTRSGRGPEQWKHWSR